MQAPRSFDVICAGEAQWKLNASRDMGLRPGGGAVNVALALATAGLRVGLATVVTDDASGRTSVEKLRARGVDIGGVTFTRPRPGLLYVDAMGLAAPLLASVPPGVEEQTPLEVPASWSSQVMLLSGLSPVVSQAAALCKAARRARRDGSTVVIDFNASLHQWVGRDPRNIQMVLREVDVARCSIADLAVLGMDIDMVRHALRPTATIVVSDGVGGAVATGPFGEVTYVPPPPPKRKPGAGDEITASICAELSRPAAPGESTSSRWHRAIGRTKSS
jgi:sugar/nucleoside kinase (ribokinase family)